MMNNSENIRILLVEDDEDKRDEIKEFILTNVTDHLVITKSFQSCKKALNANHFDVVLLDMTIPTFDVSPTEPGGRSQAFGGKLLLAEMVRKRIKSRVFVITQFDFFGSEEDGISLIELDSQLKSTYPEIYRGSISFKIGYDDWKEVLRRNLEK